jgi:hypothetical protein
MWNDRFANPCSLVARGAVFDPLTAGSLILTGIGAGVSAAGTIAGGANAAALGQSQQNEANYQAAQLRENASSELAAGQRQIGRDWVRAFTLVHLRELYRRGDSKAVSLWGGFLIERCA